MRLMFGLVAREGWERFSGKPHKLLKQVRVLPPQPLLCIAFSRTRRNLLVARSISPPSRLRDVPQEYSGTGIKLRLALFMIELRQ